MNPMTNVKNIKKLSEQDIKLGGKSSWHDQYKDSAWIFIGGLPYDLTEGDVICVFSQYGEVVHINLVRDKDTGKQKGFCFLCYEDQRSTILAVDNLNATKILGRTLRVDHVENYKAPQEGKKNPIDDETRLLREQGCAPVAVASEPSLPPTQIKQETIKLEPMIVGGVKLPPRLPIGPSRDDARPSAVKVKKEKKESKKKRDKEEKAKKSKKEKKSIKRKRKHSTSSSDSSSSSSSSESDSSEEDDRKTHRKKKR